MSRVAPVSADQDAQRRPLRLPTRNVPDHPIGLELRHEVRGAQIDLSRELLPWPRPATLLGHTAPIVLPGWSHPLAKLAEDPVGGQPSGGLRFTHRGPIAAQAHCRECDTGWPSFWQQITPEIVGTTTDYKLIFPRTEILCARCEGQQGDIFKDGLKPTGLRYCTNGVALKFVPA